MALRHECPNRDFSGSSRCPSPTAGRGPARCPGCRGRLVVEHGRYVVLRWREDGRYTWAQRAGAWQSHGRAEADAERKNQAEGYPRAGFVVRWMTDAQMGE